jgi:hypothetical protein
MKNRSLVENVSELNDVIKSFIEAKFDLWRLTLLQKITRLGTYLLSTIIIAIIILIITLLLTFAFTQWYSNTIGTLIESYLIAAGVYVLFALIVFFLRKQLFSNMMVRNIASIIFSDEESEEES